MHSPTLLKHLEDELLVLVRIDTVDWVSKLAILSTRLTLGWPSLCALGENSVLCVTLAVRRCFLVGRGFTRPPIGRARGTIKTW